MVKLLCLVTVTLTIAPGLVQAVTPTEANPPMGAKEQVIDISIEGFTPLHLTKVTLVRYSEAIDQWIPEFRATREVTKGQIAQSTVNLHITLNMKDGRVHTFSASQLVDGGYVYVVDNRGGYDPYQVASFSITADTNWAGIREVEIEDAREEAAAHALEAKEAAAARREEAARSAERAKARQNCRVIYQKTKDKKVADLTVSESKLVNVCDALGYYAP